MKKILFLLLLICIRINAYEYLIFNSDNSYTLFYTDVNGLLQIKYVGNFNNTPVTNFYGTDNYFSWESMNGIKFNKNGYIENNLFQSYYKEDLNFMNDLFNTGDLFLNYLYNKNTFSRNSHINYTNVTYLYNENGLIVESVINGFWAGLYEESDLSESGNLYNEKGDLLYVNGQPANWMQKLFDKFKFNKIINDSLSLFGSVGLVVIIICGFLIIIERFTDFSLIALIGRLGK